MSQSGTIKAKLASYPYIVGALQVLVGSLFLTLLALVKIPMYPVPVTLQTLAVFLLGLGLGARKGALACILYLVEASLGAPVLSGGTSNPLWMASPVAGYLVAFPITAFVTGFLSQKVKGENFLKAVGCLLCGQLCIDLLGVSWLAYLIGFPKAFMLGCVPFLPNMVLKILLAASLRKPLLKLRRKYLV
ncbi:MAG: biotin transporter BioY [Chlamydiae bacterium]|nr:biotin transporter BioY [Chlamydiota bacterium]